MLLFFALPFVVALLIMLRLGTRIRFVPIVGFVHGFLVGVAYIWLGEWSVVEGLRASLYGGIQGALIYLVLGGTVLYGIRKLRSLAARRAVR